MKKISSIIMVLLLSTSVLAGCATPQTPTPPQTQQTAPGNTTQPPANTSNFIGEERAREIALQRAGITSDGVIFDRTELDFDNGVWKYELEFRQGTTEYNADINAEDGTIISFESDSDD